MALHSLGTEADPPPPSMAFKAFGGLARPGPQDPPPASPTSYPTTQTHDPEPASAQPASQGSALSSVQWGLPAPASCPSAKPPRLIRCFFTTLITGALFIEHLTGVRGPATSSPSATDYSVLDPLKHPDLLPQARRTPSERLGTPHHGIMSTSLSQPTPPHPKETTAFLSAKEG